MEENFSPEGSEGSAPFNMAIASLERVNSLLKEFKNLAVNGISVDGIQYQMNSAEIQLIKINLTRQLFIAAAPLLPEKARIDLRVNIKKLKPFLRQSPQSSMWIPEFKPDKDSEIDEGILQIVLALQKEKYFMPPKDDPRFALRNR